MANNKLQGPLGTFTNVPWIDTGTMCRAPTPAPGALFLRASLTISDELTPIAEYMALEMNTNSRAAITKTMAQQNASTSTECIANYTSLPWWKQLVGLGLRLPVFLKACFSTEQASSRSAPTSFAGECRRKGPASHDCADGTTATTAGRSLRASGSIARIRST